MHDMFSLDGKVAVVTGSSRGIGRATAESMARVGARVVMRSRQQSACEPVADAIRAEGGEALAVAADIGRRDDLQALVGTTLARWGRIDVLVTNAVSNRCSGAYGLSKAADMQLARSPAMEYGKKNLRVNFIPPGLVKTEFSRRLRANDTVRAQVEAGAPLGRLGQGEDIAGVAVFLASRAAAFVIGQTLVADGGLTIGG